MTVDQSHAVFASRTFLLVEDFEAMRGILRELLVRCGAKKIEVASNAREALAILRRVKCDIVLCDFNLGEGKNGQQLLEEARHAGYVSPACVWIMVTAEKTFSMVMSAVEHQPDDYLIKPITEATLQARLGRLLARKAVLAEISSAMRNKEFTRALMLCERRIQEDPSNRMEIQRIQGDIHLHLSQWDEAYQLYDSVLARRDVVWARLGMARLHVRQNKLSKAHGILQQLITDSPNCLDAYDELAKIYGRTQEWGQAERVLTQAVNLSPNSPGRQTRLGDAALHCQHYELAERCFVKAIKLAAHSTLKVTAPYLGLSKVYLAQQKINEAHKVLALMMQEIPGEETQLQAKLEEIQIYHAIGNIEKATALADEVSGAVQSGFEHLTPEMLLDLAQTFMQLGNTGAATGVLQFVVRNNHEDESIGRRVMEIFTLGDMELEGRGLIEACRREAIGTMDQGVRLAAQGKLDEALECLREAKTLMPRNPRLLLNFAYMGIAKLQRHGWRHDLETEVRKAITAARQIVPGEKRCGELLVQLEALC